MSSPVSGRRLLAVVMVTAVLLLLAAGCQQKQQNAPQAEGSKPAAATAQLPQPMLDALHGKAPGGQTAPPQGMPGMPPQGMPMAMPQGGGMSPGGMKMPGGMPRVPSTIIVSDEIKRSWKAVVVQVSEAGGATKDYRVPINGQLAIPGSGLTLKVEGFLPDFKMTAAGITSLSNTPKNPAARVMVVEGGKTIFKGWLFKLFPEAHPFQHPKYRVILKDAVAA